MLPTDPEERKKTPIYSGVLMYFPLAIAAVARCSWMGNEQHHPGTPLHWDRKKSADELDALVRHLMDPEARDEDGVLHVVKALWRLLAYVQKLLERIEEDEVVTRAWVQAGLKQKNPDNIVANTGGRI